MKIIWFLFLMACAIVAGVVGIIAMVTFLIPLMIPIGVVVLLWLAIRLFSPKTPPTP